MKMEESVRGKLTLIFRGGCDLCYQHGALIDIANAIALRYDAGICRHKYEHPGVVEIYEMSEMKESKEIKEIRLGNVYNDEKYTGANFGGSVWDSNAVSPTMKTGASASQQCIVEPIVIGSMQEHASVRNDGICPTLTEAMGKGGGQTPMVMVKQATKDGYIPCEVGGVCDLNYPSSTTRRGRVQENGRVCPTLTTENIPSVLEPWIWEVDGVRYLIRIRKLTPRECWRLMGFTDGDFDKAQAVNSNTQLYKQAGNSIVADVLENLFKQLL